MEPYNFERTYTATFKRPLPLSLPPRSRYRPCFSLQTPPALPARPPTPRLPPSAPPPAAAVLPWPTQTVTCVGRHPAAPQVGPDRRPCRSDGAASPVSPRSIDGAPQPPPRATGRRRRRQDGPRQLIPRDVSGPPAEEPVTSLARSVPEEEAEEMDCEGAREVTAVDLERSMYFWMGYL